MTRPHANHRSNTRQAGFTLVEILVVVVIVGLLATIVAQNVFGSTEQAKLQSTKADLAAIKSAAERYKLQNNGHYPEELAQLVEVQESGLQYLQLSDVPTDKWNQLPYRMEKRGAKVVIICDGFDGEPDTDDDITTENMGKIKLDEYLKLINQTNN